MCSVYIQISLVHTLKLYFSSLKTLYMCVLRQPLVFIMIPFLISNCWFLDEWHSSHHTHRLFLLIFWHYKWLFFDTMGLNHLLVMFCTIDQRILSRIWFTGQQCKGSSNSFPNLTLVFLTQLKAPDTVQDYCRGLSSSRCPQHETSFIEMDKAVIKSQPMNSQMKCHADSL